MSLPASNGQHHPRAQPAGRMLMLADSAEQSTKNRCLFSSSEPCTADEAIPALVLLSDTGIRIIQG